MARAMQSRLWLVQLEGRKFFYVVHHHEIIARELAEKVARQKGLQLVNVSQVEDNTEVYLCGM